MSVQSLPQHLLTAPQSSGTAFNRTDLNQTRAFGEEAGNRLFELQRRRLASQGQGQQRNLARMFAGRGGGASSAAAAAGQQQQIAERNALADASLQSQLEGQRIGMAESQRLGQQEQFASQLQQSTNLANLQARMGIQSQTLGGQQALQQQMLAIQAQRNAQKRANKGGLLRGLGGALGGIFGGPVGGFLGSKFAGLFGGGGGGGDPFQNAVPDSSGETFS